MEILCTYAFYCINTYVLHIKQLLIIILLLIVKILGHNVVETSPPINVLQNFDVGSRIGILMVPIMVGDNT